MRSTTKRTDSRSRTSQTTGGTKKRSSSGNGGGSRRGTSSRGGGTATQSRSRHLSHTTTDHDEIKRWAEERGAHPAVVKSTRGTKKSSAEKGGTGVLRLDFLGYSGEGSLEEISWDEFFKTFDKNHLALVYQDKTASGQKSNFNKLVRQD